MHKDLETLCVALDQLAAAVLSGWNGDQIFTEAFGWNCAAVTRHDMAAVATQLAADIRDIKSDVLDPALLKLAQDCPRRLNILKSQTIQQFWGGNSGQATAAYMTTLHSIRQNFVPLQNWQMVQDSKAMPANLSRRLRAIQAELDQIAPNKESLTNQIKQIQEAHSVAESLPIDLQTLADARDRVVGFANESSSSVEKITGNLDTSTKKLESIVTAHETTQKLVAQCEDAYRITTTKGLAAAFDQRAKRLGWSLWAWVLGLLLALAGGAKIGSIRIEQLSNIIYSPQLQWHIFWVEVILSLLSIGAPVWFAWIATKQIGQRFRLAEDYAFKASVAKAYEGYRKEAARLDPAFEARLFASALARLDEAPLRFVEQTSHGSPWHELFASSQFQNALATIPELKDKFIEIAKQGASSITAQKEPKKPEN